MRIKVCAIVGTTTIAVIEVHIGDALISVTSIESYILTQIKLDTGANLIGKVT